MEYFEGIEQEAKEAILSREGKFAAQEIVEILLSKAERRGKRNKEEENILKVVVEYLIVKMLSYSQIMVANCSIGGVDWYWGRAQLDQKIRFEIESREYEFTEKDIVNSILSLNPEIRHCANYVRFIFQDMIKDGELHERTSRQQLRINTLGTSAIASSRTGTYYYVCNERGVKMNYLERVEQEAREAILASKNSFACGMIVNQLLSKTERIEVRHNKVEENTLSAIVESVICKMLSSGEIVSADCNVGGYNWYWCTSQIKQGIREEIEGREYEFVAQSIVDAFLSKCPPLRKVGVTRIVRGVIAEMVDNKELTYQCFRDNSATIYSCANSKRKPVADSCSTCAKEPTCKLSCYKKEVSDFCSKQYTCDEYSKGAFQKLKELASKLNFRRIK